MISNQVNDDDEASLQTFTKLKLIAGMIMDLQQELGLELLGLGLWVAKIVSA